MQEDREDARTGYSGLANERVLIVILNENVRAEEHIFLFFNMLL